MKGGFTNLDEPAMVKTMRPKVLKPLQRLFFAKRTVSAEDRRLLTQQVLAKTLALGATAAGIADVKALRDSFSHQTPTVVRWPPDARSALVMALEHPDHDPMLDWWDGRPGQTPGNRQLIRIGKTLVRWLKKEHRINARSVPYKLNKGGIFVKDAAVLAGLGVIGKNNLLITKGRGPRVRLRAVLLTVELDPSPPQACSPCEGCSAPCVAVCPQNAFRSGRYDKDCCERQMLLDEAASRRQGNATSDPIRYCRACELACPVGQMKTNDQ
jgi:epoxyqueuosine reductase